MIHVELSDIRTRIARWLKLVQPTFPQINAPLALCSLSPPTDSGPFAA